MTETRQYDSYKVDGPLFNFVFILASFYLSESGGETIQDWVHACGWACDYITKHGCKEA